MLPLFKSSDASQPCPACSHALQNHQGDEGLGNWEDLEMNCRGYAAEEPFFTSKYRGAGKFLSSLSKIVLLKDR
jgi:hypothetical protein